MDNFTTHERCKAFLFSLALASFLLLGGYAAQAAERVNADGSVTSTSRHPALDTAIHTSIGGGGMGSRTSATLDDHGSLDTPSTTAPRPRHRSPCQANKDGTPQRGIVGRIVKCPQEDANDAKESTDKPAAAVTTPADSVTIDSDVNAEVVE